MKWFQLLSVGFGGALGAMCRFGISYAIAQRSASLFPWGTLAANVAGCFLLGALYEAGSWIAIDPELRFTIAVGFLGALTTFSTFTLETLNLVRDKEWGMAVLNVGANGVIGIAACLAATWLVRALGKAAVA